MDQNVSQRLFRLHCIDYVSQNTDPSSAASSRVHGPDCHMLCGFSKAWNALKTIQCELRTYGRQTFLLERKLCIMHIALGSDLVFSLALGSKTCPSFLA